MPRLLVIVLLVLAASGARTAVGAPGSPLIYASATMGTPGQTGGPSLTHDPFDQYLGARFQLSQPMIITGVGGHVAAESNFGNRVLWGAIVQLSGPNDFPNSTNMSTPDVLAHTTFTPTLDSSSDGAFDIGPLFVPPGTYGVVLGTGLFGATGQGYMPGNNPNIGSPSLFALNPNTGLWTQGSTMGIDFLRFTVYGVVPEPVTAAALAGAMLLIRRPCRRAL